MSVSYWERADVEETARHEVVVLGAGVVGLSAMLALQERGVDGVCLERGCVGSGASTRNAGYLMRGAADNYAAGVRQWGRDVARGLWRMTEGNLAKLRSLRIESLGSYRARGSCVLALEEAEEAELRESLRLMEEDGFAVEAVTAGTDGPWKTGRARFGLVNPNDAVINPRELIDHLRAMVRLPVLEHREVFAVERDGGREMGDRLVVRARGMTIEAGRVLCCLNAFAPPLLPELAGAIEPNRGQMLAIRDREAELRYAYYTDHGSEYFRRADPETIVVGGWRKHFREAERTTSETTSAEVQGGLEGFARSVLGVRGPVVARWAGTMGFSSTGLPIVGGLSADPRITICAGFTGHGMSLGHLAAGLAVETMLDGAPAPFPVPDVVCSGRAGGR